MNGKVERIAVIGAGIIGAGLAQHFAQSGYPVALYDVSGEALEKGLRRARNNLLLQADLCWVSDPDIDAALGRITTSTDLGDAVADADFVIEAVPEVLELKKKVFGRLGDLAPPHAVLASNTSTINVMAEVSDDIAGRVLITHFFNPPQLAERVERGELGVKTGKGFYDYEGTSEEEILRRRDYRLMLLLDAHRKGREPGGVRRASTT